MGFQNGSRGSRWLSCVAICQTVSIVSLLVLHNTNDSSTVMHVDINMFWNKKYILLFMTEFRLIPMYILTRVYFLWCRDLLLVDSCHYRYSENTQHRCLLSAKLVHERVTNSTRNCCGGVAYEYWSTLSSSVF